MQRISAVVRSMSGAMRAPCRASSVGLTRAPSAGGAPRTATAPVRTEREPVFAEPAHRLRIDAMLLAQHARGERVFVVVLVHGHRSLHHDGPVIERRRDEMDRAAVDAHAGLERARCVCRPGNKAQRGMDVDEPARVMTHEGLGELAHEAREHDEIGAVGVDRLAQCGVERLAVGIERGDRWRSPECRASVRDPARVPRDCC